METNARFAECRIDKEPWSRAKGVVLMAFGYILALVVFVIVGATGPPVFNYKSTEYQSPYASYTLPPQIYTNMESWHQLMYLRTRTQLPPTIKSALGGSSLTQTNNTYYVKAWGSPQNFAYRSEECQYGCVTCPEGVPGELSCEELLSGEDPSVKTFTCEAEEEWCGWVGLLNIDFVNYHTYYFEVRVVSPLGNVDTADVWQSETELIYLQEKWTWFQNAWCYSFVIIVLAFMLLPRLGFFVCMLRVPKALWSRQQKWTAALLVSLFFFNNPFYAAMIWSSSPGFWYGVYGMAVATFLALLCVFWLDLFDDIGAGNQASTVIGNDVMRQRGGRGWSAVLVARVWLVGLLWLALVLAFVYVRLRQSGDPTEYTYNDFSTYTATKVLLVAAATAYLLWLVWKMVMAAPALLRLAGPYRYLFVITLVTIPTTMAAVYAGVLAPNQYGALGFCVTYGILNIYVMTLAWLYSATGSYYQGFAQHAVDDRGRSTSASNGDVEDVDLGNDGGTATATAKSGTDGRSSRWGRSDSGAAANNGLEQQPGWALEVDDAAEADAAPARGWGRRLRAPYL